MTGLTIGAAALDGSDEGEDVIINPYRFASGGGASLPSGIALHFDASTVSGSDGLKTDWVPVVNDISLASANSGSMTLNSSDPVFSAPVMEFGAGFTWNSPAITALTDERFTVIWHGHFSAGGVTRFWGSGNGAFWGLVADDYRFRFLVQSGGSSHFTPNDTFTSGTSQQKAYWVQRISKVGDTEATELAGGASAGIGLTGYFDLAALTTTKGSTGHIPNSINQFGDVTTSDASATDVIFYDRYLTDSELEDVAAYFDAKFA